MQQRACFALTIVQHYTSYSDVSYNNLTSLPGNVFSGLASLTTL
jgi:hypothetical protein